MLNRKTLVMISCPLGLVVIATQARPQVPPAQQLDQIMNSRFAANDFNGAVLVARQGRVLYQHAFGRPHPQRSASS